MKTKVEKAIDTIKGFCGKHDNCDRCRYRTEAGGCMFREDIPYYWDSKTDNRGKEKGE